jgi:hypothetical protein
LQVADGRWQITLKCIPHWLYLGDTPLHLAAASLQGAIRARGTEAVRELLACGASVAVRRGLRVNRQADSDDVRVRNRDVYSAFPAMTAMGETSDVPDVTMIDAVAEIIAERLAFYRALSVATGLGAVTGIVIVITSLQASEWVPSTMKLVSTASAAFGGVFPVAAYFKWKGLFVLCRNYRKLSLEYQSSRGNVTAAAYSRATISFWRLYETTWEK